MKIEHSKKVGLAVIFALVLAYQPIHAGDCTNATLIFMDNLGSKAKEYMIKALESLEADNLNKAQYYAGMAKPLLLDVSHAASSCDCYGASVELNEAASAAGRARDAIHYDDFANNFKIVVLSYRSGYESLYECIKKRIGQNQ